jgi:hypothetical protein
MAQATSPHLKQDAACWISGEYMTAQFLSKLSSAFQSDRTTMHVLRNFLISEKAFTLAEHIKTSVVWDRACLIFATDCFSEYSVSEDVWNQTPPDKLFARFDISKSLATCQSGADTILADFLKCLSSRSMFQWVAAFTASEVQEVINVRVTRYRNRDFIREHFDSQGGQIVRCNLYLDPGWRTEMGGVLSLRNEHDEVLSVPPTFNCLVLTPITQKCRHWVDMVATVHPCRESIAFEFRPTAS